MAYVTGATGGSVGTPGRMVMPHFDPSVLNIDTVGIMSKGFDLGQRMEHARQDREDELKLKAAQIKAAEASASSDALKLKEAEKTHVNRVKAINEDATLNATVKARLVEQEKQNYDNYLSAAKSAAEAEAILKRGAAAQAPAVVKANENIAETNVLATAGDRERMPDVQTLKSQGLGRQLAASNVLGDNPFAVQTVNGVTGVLTSKPTGEVGVDILPHQKSTASNAQTKPVYMGEDEKGNAIIQNFTIDPTTGTPVHPVGAKIVTSQPTADTIGVPDTYKAPTRASAGQKKMDEAMFKSVATFDDDAAKFQSSSAQLARAKEKLQSSSGPTSGSLAGFIPDKTPGMGNRREVSASIQSAIQSQLRAIYGSQFTQKEGERFFQTAFDKFASEEDNAKRLEMLQQSLSRAFSAKKAMAEWAQTHDSFQGYKGLTFSQSDTVTAEEMAADIGFDPYADKSEGGVLSKASVSEKQKTPNPLAPKKEEKETTVDGYKIKKNS